MATPVLLRVEVETCMTVVLLVPLPLLAPLTPLVALVALTVLGSGHMLTVAGLLLT